MTPIVVGGDYREMGGGDNTATAGGGPCGDRAPRPRADLAAEPLTVCSPAARPCTPTRSNSSSCIFTHLCQTAAQPAAAGDLSVPSDRAEKMTKSSANV